MCKLHLLSFYPSTWYICDFFLFHIEINGKGGWIIWGPKGMLIPSFSNYFAGGGAGTPSAYAYENGILIQEGLLLHLYQVDET